MNLSHIKNIIFDLGGVIININPQLTYNAFEHLSGKQVMAENLSLDHVKLFSDYERGLITEPEFVLKMNRFLNINATSNEVLSAWNQILLDIPKPRIDILECAKSNFNTFLLSNTNYTHRVVIDQMIQSDFGKNGLEALFHKVYTSYEMKLQKPEKAIFEQVLLENNLKPEETLFIDDTEKHINSAKNLGIHTILATSDYGITEIFKPLCS